MVDKVLQRQNGKTKQYRPITVSNGASDAGKLIAVAANGKLDPSLYDPGADPSRPIVAFEALGAGKFYNLFVDGGTVKARLADNSNGRPADGFVREAVEAAASGTGFPLDSVNSSLSGLTPGTTYYLGTAGGVIDTPLDASDDANINKIDQKLGKAASATELETDDYDYVVL